MNFEISDSVEEMNLKWKSEKFRLSPLYFPSKSFKYIEKDALYAMCNDIIGTNIHAHRVISFNYRTVFAVSLKKRGWRANVERHRISGARNATVAPPIGATFKHGA